MSLRIGRNEWYAKLFHVEHYGKIRENILGNEG